MNTSKELKLKLGKAVIEERNIKFKLLNNSLSDLEKKRFNSKKKITHFRNYSNLSIT